MRGLVLARLTAALWLSDDGLDHSPTEEVDGARNAAALAPA